jgi:Tfp pilus assembly protein PilO
MTRLSKEKRQQLILAILVTATVVAGFYFTVIRWQQQNLREAQDKKQTAQRKLEDVRKAVQEADRIQSDLVDFSRKLADREKNIASGDLLAWVFTTIRQFKRPYDVDVPQFGSIITEPTTAFAEFPYKQFRITLGGTAHYHDLGRFIADLENRFPEVRVANLDLQPAPLAPGQSEMLLFRMDLVVLIKQE